MDGLEQFWPKVLQRLLGETLVYELERNGRHVRWGGHAPLVRVNGGGPVVMYEGEERLVCRWSELQSVESVDIRYRRQ